MSSSAPIVFIASTCYDLADLRAELRQHLGKDGFIVRLSDDFDSDFRVDPSVGSIESCLENLRTSNIALFVLDRRYGPPLGGEYGDRSATHLEFTTAVDHEMKILSFIRKRTMDEFDQWRGNSETFSPRWTDKKQYTQLFEFIQEVRDLHNPEGRSNWIDFFDTSPDLRKIASKRLYDIFPAQAGGRALRPERVVRLQFLGDSGASGMFFVPFRVRNVGLNIAVEVRAFLMTEGEDVGEEHYLSVLAVNETSPGWQFEFGSAPKGRELVCEYRNLWGDTYEVRAPLVPASDGLFRPGREQFRAVQAE